MVIGEVVEIVVVIDVREKGDHFAGRYVDELLVVIAVREFEHRVASPQRQIISRILRIMSDRLGNGVGRSRRIDKRQRTIVHSVDDRTRIGLMEVSVRWIVGKSSDANYGRGDTTFERLNGADGGNALHE